MKNYKDLYSWNECLKIIKENSPKGLFELWKELNPVGVIEWTNGLLCSDNSDNSYNWLDIDSNNIVFQTIYLNNMEEEKGLIGIAFHISGDVRGNYTDYFLFQKEEIFNLIFPFEDSEWKNLGGEIEE